MTCTLRTLILSLNKDPMNLYEGEIRGSASKRRELSIFENGRSEIICCMAGLIASSLFHDCIVNFSMGYWDQIQ